MVASREQPWGDANVVYHTTESLLTRFKLDHVRITKRRLLLKRITFVAADDAVLGGPGVYAVVFICDSMYISMPNQGPLASMPPCLHASKTPCLHDFMT